jgi:hypothetical protein
MVIITRPASEYAVHYFQHESLRQNSVTAIIRARLTNRQNKFRPSDIV